MPLAVPPPLDVNDLLVVERARLLDTLSALSASEWAAPTECPAWDVKGVALHILGDDFSLLSRQRDEAVNSLVLLAEELPGVDFSTLLNTFNERWVHLAQFFGTPLIIELLQVTGDLTAEWYRTVPADQLGEPVFFVGPDPAPYWMIAAREFGERFIHHCQIARATGRSVPDDPSLVLPFMAGAVRGFPQTLALLDAPAGSAVTVEVDERAWTIRHDPDGWVVYDGRPDDPTVGVHMTGAAATAVFTRGLGHDGVRAVVDVTGAPPLAQQIGDGLAAFFGRAD
jgi:uncharacterized protein (TIGR03083 family)